MARIRACLGSLDLGLGQQDLEPACRYSGYYSLDPGPAASYIGTIEVSRLRIAVQVMIPAQPQATVYLIHGYLTHSALCFRHLVAYLLRARIAVVMVDLPGHGLSEGTRGGIADFAVYAEVIKAVTRYCERALGRPWHVVGHSTGCAAIIEFLAREATPFAKHILIAPLVHSVLWIPSRVGYALFGWTGLDLPRVFRQTFACLPTRLPTWTTTSSRMADTICSTKPR